MHAIIVSVSGTHCVYLCYHKRELAKCVLHSQVASDMHPTLLPTQRRPYASSLYHSLPLPTVRIHPAHLTLTSRSTYVNTSIHFVDTGQLNRVSPRQGDGTTWDRQQEHWGCAWRRVLLVKGCRPRARVQRGSAWF